jgi:hypothetical protein
MQLYVGVSFDHHHVTNQAIASMPSTPRPTGVSFDSDFASAGSVKHDARLICMCAVAVSAIVVLISDCRHHSSFLIDYI